MSVHCMGLVFKRYPGGGSMRLLALALADHANDDGERIFPSIRLLAEKTMQSERAVQYQIQKMLDMGWLEFVGEAKFHHGRGRGVNQGREYRISPEWMRGEAIVAPVSTLPEEPVPVEKGCKSCTPSEDEKGCNLEQKGCNPAQEGVQDLPGRGATAIAPKPSYNHQEDNRQGERAHAQTRDDSLPTDPDPADATHGRRGLIPEDWFPDERVIRERMRMAGFPDFQVRPAQVVKFISHYRSRSEFRNLREYQALFQRWCVDDAQKRKGQPGAEESDDEVVRRLEVKHGGDHATV